METETRATFSKEAKKLFWQQQISNWQASGLSQKEFCRHQKLALSTFSYWKRKIEIPEPEEVTFYPLAIAASNSQPSDSGLRIFVGKKNIVVDISEDFSATALKKLILTLEQL